MITPGQTLENPVTGERFTFTATAASTGGELLAFDFALRPGGAVPIPHVHPVQTERFEVVSGRMRFRVGRRTVHAGPGDVVEVAPGVMHAFANDGDEEARLRVEVRPALRMEEMFAEVVAMAEAGRMTRRGLPRNLLDLATLARRYDEEARLRVEVRPALRMEEMLAEVVAMAKAGRMTRRGLPRNLLDLATLARRYDQEARAPFLRVGVQRLLLAPLVASARHPRGARVAAVAGGIASLGLLG